MQVKNQLQLHNFLNLESSTILAELAQAYGFNLFDSKSEIYLKLEQEGYDRLVLERNEPHVISLSHYFVQNGDLMSNPDMTFLIKPTLDNTRLLIFPLSYTLSSSGIYREAAELSHDCSSIKSANLSVMNNLADIANTWISNIKAQSWFLPNAKPNPEVTVTTD